MMLQYKFLDLKELVGFCEYITPLNVEVTAYIGKNQSVDAKSILGLTAFDISNQIDFYIFGEESDVEKIKYWIDLHQSQKEV